jgi:hypothetical protein
MQTRDPKPEIMRLEELAVLVKSGDIKLPRFQRPFVWKEADMLKLLDSIYKGYPIGSILLWNSSQRLTSVRSILGLAVNTEGSTFFPTNYLLDGQQRLTTLCGALFWNGDDESSMWNIHFDLEAKQFVCPKESNLVNLFPLNKLIETRDFIRQCMKFDHHPRRDEYYKLAERLLKSIKDYKIAVVTIGDMTIEEVAPIFERINSTGRKLTIVDLMMAATWSNGFDLTTKIKEIRERCSAAGFDDIGDQIILRSIAASADLGLNKEDIQKLRSKSPSDLSSAADAAGLSIVRALEFLSSEIGIYDFSYVPYGFQLSYIAEYFRISPAITPDHSKHLVEWFWFTSATRYFASSSTTGQVTKDLGLIRSFANRKRDRLFEYQEIDISKLLYDSFNLRTATSTTFTTLLNSLKPVVTLDGTPIDGSHAEVKSSKFFAAFCPTHDGLERQNLSKIIHPYPLANRTLTFDPNIDPDLSVAALHLLDANCLDAVKANDPTAFLSARSLLVAARLRALTGCGVTFKHVALSTNKAGDSDDVDIEDQEESS